MTRELILMVGIPGSGKSTIANRECDEILREGGSAVVISRDNIRFDMLQDSDDYFKYEKRVFHEFVRQINEALEMGIEYIYVDATHLTKASRRKVLSKLKLDNTTTLVIYVVDCPLEVCLARNERREGRKKVPQDVIKQVKGTFEFPLPQEFSSFQGRISYRKKED